jgi:hypothetical protein
VHGNEGCRTGGPAAQHRGSAGMLCAEEGRWNEVCGILPVRLLSARASGV